MRKLFYKSTFIVTLALNAISCGTNQKESVHTNVTNNIVVNLSDVYNEIELSIPDKGVELGYRGDNRLHIMIGNGENIEDFDITTSEPEEKINEKINEIKTDGHYDTKLIESNTNYLIYKGYLCGENGYIVYKKIGDEVFSSFVICGLKDENAIKTFIDIFNSISSVSPKSTHKLNEDNQIVKIQ